MPAMNRSFSSSVLSLALAFAGTLAAAPQSPDARRETLSDEMRCAALADLPNLSITTAVVRPQTNGVPQHCYVRGTIAGGRIRFNM